MNYQEIAKELIIGMKYTLVKFSEFGFPYSIQFTHKEAKIEKYAQYPETLQLIFVPKGKRNPRGVRIYPGSPDFIIWQGWVEPNTEMYIIHEKPEDDITVSTSRRCFSSDYLKAAEESVNVPPIFKSIRN